MRFQVKAVKSGAGEVVSLVLDARDAHDANEQAQAQGYLVVGVRPARAVALPQGFGRIRFPLVLFTQELLALLRSGISLLEALETLTEKEGRGTTAGVLGGLTQRLKQGQSFSSSLQAFPQTFPELYVATVRASERTGGLQEALGRYVTYQNQLDGVKKTLVSASIYPAILMVVGGLVCIFLLGYVVPRFSRIYEDIGGNLPWLTRLLMGWGGFVEKRGGALLVALCVAVVALVAWLRQPSAKRWIGRQVARIPTIGQRARVYQLTRFYRTVGMLLGGGTPVTQALGMVAGLLDHDLQQRLAQATRSIREGQPISVSLNAQALTTPVALRMLRVGERTGQMGEMMERIAAFHEEELARWVERFTRVFEPLLMALIGVVIGGIVVLMYFPIFELAGSMH
jgi:general secretion pathway protein F